MQTEDYNVLRYVLSHLGRGAGVLTFPGERRLLGVGWEERVSADVWRTSKSSQVTLVWWWGGRSQEVRAMGEHGTLRPWQVLGFG